jgi:hypothetical protein
MLDLYLIRDPTLRRIFLAMGAAILIIVVICAIVGIVLAVKLR